MTLGLFNAFRIRFMLPKAPHELRPTDEARQRPTGPGPLRNPGWMATCFFNGVMWTNQTLLNVVIPLWLVHDTDSPRWLLAWLFGTNTVLCIFLPAYTSKGVTTIGDAMRRVWIATAFFIASCLITMVTHTTTGLITVFLVWLGHVAVTGCELAISSASWTFQANLMEPSRRGEYQGVAGIFSALGMRWSPFVFTWLAISWHGPGWLVIAGFPILAAVGLGPATRSAERFLARHTTAETVATA
jgi:MFS family permease